MKCPSFMKTQNPTASFMNQIENGHGLKYEITVSVSNLKSFFKK